MAVELSQQEVVPSVNTPVIRELQEPHFKFASGGVKSSRRAIKFEENILRDFLRFSDIVDDSQGDSEDQAIIAIEEHGEGIAIATLHFEHQFFIGQRAVRRRVSIRVAIPI